MSREKKVPNTKTEELPESRICQGDIIRNVDYIEEAEEVGGIIKISKIEFPLIVVLTQDCDLNQDHACRASGALTGKKNEDKLLLSVIVAPIYNLDHVIGGEHLRGLNRSMRLIESETEKGLIKKNEIPRYHFMQFEDKIPVPPSVIDFKHYFSSNTEYLLKVKKNGGFVCKVSPLYRERISQRFSDFLSRIGLPPLDAT